MDSLQYNIHSKAHRSEHQTNGSLIFSTIFSVSHFNFEVPS